MKKNDRNYIHLCLGAAALFLAAAAALVILIDPFYHFHGPLPGLKAVVTKSEYQCIGTIRNLSYDSVLAGSSTAENYNNRWFDEGFGCRTVKAIKSSGTTADLKYYLDEAFATHQVKNVFYSLDLFALAGDPDTNFVDGDMPLYLYDDNPWNDIFYVLNKDVLMKDIPYLFAVNFLEDYDEGTSYNWAQDKVFSAEETLSHYNRQEEISSMLGREEYGETVEKNVALLVRQVEAHPETDFYFLMPPYSMLWWDSAYRSGLLEQYRYAARLAMEELIGYENVKLFFFCCEERIILDLNHYMDPIHFSDRINQFIALQAADDAGAYRVTEENYEEKLERMDALVERILDEEMPALFGEEKGEEGL